jgi:hypothetical protein
MTETDEMEALGEKRKAKEENEINRKLLIEPNLEIMSTWLKEINTANKASIYNQNRMNPTIGLTAKDLMTPELTAELIVSMFNIMSARLTELEKGDGRQGE